MLIDLPYNVYATGSTGNDVEIGNLRIDAWSPQKNYDLDQVDCVYITHRHADHLRPSTLKWFLKNDVIVLMEQVNKRAKRSAPLNKLTAEELDKIHWFNHKKPVTIQGNTFKYTFNFTQKLDHNVPVYGLKLWITSIYGDYWRVFYATDIGNLKDVEAIDYDYYFVENNYKARRLNALIQRDLRYNKWSRYSRSRREHLSLEQGDAFVNKYKGDHFKEYIRLHQSKTAF